MMQKFIIIEDNATALAQYKSQFIELGIDQDNIWPSDDKTFENWDNVFSVLNGLKKKGFDPQKECVVLFLDLSLDNKASIAPAIAKLKSAVDFLKPYVVFVCSIMAEAAKEKLEQLTDVIVLKTIIARENPDNIELLRTYLATATKNWESRTMRSPGTKPWIQFKIRDSQETRRAEAAIGFGAFRELVELRAKGWDDVVFTVLTPGYSGAYIARIEGRENGAPRSLVCKLSRSREELEKELDSWRRAQESGIYPEGTAVILEAVKELRSGSPIFYFVQSNVVGKSLDQTILGNIVRGDYDESHIEETAGSVLRDVTESQRRAIVGNVTLDNTLKSLKLSDKYIERFTESLPDLRVLYEECIGGGYLTQDVRIQALLESENLENIVKSWNKIIDASTLRSLPVCEQHGDMNARNMILSEEGKVRLIDFARFGSWPVLYDFTRLELQLWHRLVGIPQMRENFPEELKTWWDLWQKKNNRDYVLQPPSGKDINKRALACQVWISHKISESIKETVKLLENRVDFKNFDQLAYLLMAFDAIKMVSYDTSWFKRLFFLLVFIDCFERAKLK